MDGVIGTFDGIPVRYCKCGASPEIYEEGVAKRYLTGEDQTIFFADEGAFFVECGECGEGACGRTPKAAINNWNNIMERYNG